MEYSRTAERKLRSVERELDNKHHLARLAHAMAPDPTRWEYRGVMIDGGRGLMVNSCTCGHPIRWIFKIHNKDDGRTLPIGSTCIGSSVPYLVASGAEGLAEALQRAVKKHQEALAAAQREVRDAENSEVVKGLMDTRQQLFDWARGEREAGTYLPRSLWTDAVRFEHRRVKALSTPGRLAASLRKKLTGHYVGAFEVVKRPSANMPLPEDEALRAKILEGVREVMARSGDDKKRRLCAILDALERMWN